MRLWDNLRTAFTLANRVEEVEKGLQELEWEWGEIEEKLLTREERLRKRLSRELKATLDAPTVPEAAPTLQLAPAGNQTAKKAIAARFREQREG